MEVAAAAVSRVKEQDRDVVVAVVVVDSSSSTLQPNMGEQVDRTLVAVVVLCVVSPDVTETENDVVVEHIDAVFVSQELGLLSYVSWLSSPILMAEVSVSRYHT